MFKRTHQTLLEQMQISDVEIQNRIELATLDPESFTLLADARTVVEENVDDLVEQFYAIQLSVDEIAVLIGDADTLDRLKKAQRQYILDLFSGRYDSAYVNNRLRIGMVHKRIGVKPKLYLSGISALKTILFQLLDEAIKDRDVLAATRCALDKLFYFDTTLVFDTYIASMISEIEVAQKKTEEYATSLEQKVAERTAQLEELAKRDPLTGIYNQRAMRERTGQMLASVKRRNSVVSLVYCDVDDFKVINDQHGHLKGDEVLRSVGKIIQANVREMDIPCRYGGDEFCILLPDTDPEAAGVLCERIIRAFAEEYPDFSLSMGIAHTGPDDYLSDIELIALADAKMYQAKAVAGSHVHV